MIDLEALRGMLDPSTVTTPVVHPPDEEPSSPGGSSPYVSKPNLQLVKTWPCILHGHYGCDPCHYPVRRSQHRDDSLLNLLPICREWHRRLDLYDDDAIKFVESVAEYHWRWVLRTYGDLPSARLGTPERILEVLHGRNSNRTDDARGDSAARPA